MEIFSVHCTVLLVLACYIKVTFQFNINHVNVDTDVPLQPFHYTASVLRSLKPVDLSCYKPTVPLPPEVTVPRKRGRRGGVKNRLKKKRNRIPLPIVITGNARSLNNKVDELSACARHHSEYRHAPLIAFSETWFNNKSTSIEVTEPTLRARTAVGACVSMSTKDIVIQTTKQCVHNRTYLHI